MRRFLRQIAAANGSAFDDLPFIGRIQSQNQLEEGGFPRSVGAHQSQAVRGVDLKRQILKELLGPEGVLVEGDPDSAEAGRWQDEFLYARAYTIAGGANEVMRNMISERGLQMPKDPKGHPKGK